MRNEVTDKNVVNTSRPDSKRKLSFTIQIFLILLVLLLFWVIGKGIINIAKIASSTL
jgi:hypothetical protein